MRCIALVGTCSESQDNLSMAVTEGRFNDLQKRVNEIGERVARMEGVSTTPEKSHTVLITILSILGTGVVLYWAWLGYEVVDYGKQLAAIHQLLAPVGLKEAADNPSNPSSVKEAKLILSNARKRNQPIDSKLLHQTGEQFIEASVKSPDAWDTAMAFLDYRSFLNVSVSPPVADSQPAAGICTFTGKTHIIVPKGETPDEAAQSQTFSLIGTLQENNVARFEEIDKPTQGCGFQFLLYQMPRAGNELLLDGLYIRNAIIKDTRIAYHGGDVRLENVYFVNCTFDFPLAPQVRDLATAI